MKSKIFKELRPKKVFLCLFIISIVSLTILLANLIYNEITRQSSSEAENSEEYQYAKPSQQIQGLTYTSHIDTKKRIVIQCDYFTIKRKKIGGLRLGLVKEAILYNGKIRLYQYPDDPDIAKKSKDIKDIDDKNIQDVFQTIVSPNSPLLSGLKNISSVIINPVLIELFTNNMPLTKIIAQSAVFDLGHSRIIFSGKVRVTSGQKELLIPRLELNTVTKQLTGENYTLKTPSGMTSGQYIVTDLYLGN